MTHKYNVGDTVWVAGLTEHTTPFQMTITDIHIDNKGVYYDGNEVAPGTAKMIIRKSEKLLYLTQTDCIEFMNKRTLDDCYQKRNTLLYELEGLNNKIKYYEDLIK
jgi:hypothetical protein